MASRVEMHWRMVGTHNQLCFSLIFSLESPDNDQACTLSIPLVFFLRYSQLLENNVLSRLV